MTDDDLCYLAANEALSLFRKRKLKPTELLAALQKRAAKLNPAINCLADQYWDEAMAMARPVVVSADSATGLAARPGQEFEIARGGDDTVRHVVALLADPARRSEMGTAARSCVVDYYSWQAHLAQLDSLLAVGTGAVGTDTVGAGLPANAASEQPSSRASPLPQKQSPLNQLPQNPLPYER